MKILNRTYICMLIFTLALAMGTNVHAAEMSEYEIKSGMVYNFTLFVEWPVEKLARTNSMDVCIAGENALTRPFYRMNGKTYKSHTISVRPVNGPDSMSGCKILFITRSQDTQLQSYLQNAQKLSILTISDIDNFASQGGIIGFFEQNGKVRFEINQESARLSKIRINSQLLKLARIVTSRK